MKTFSPPYNIRVNTLPPPSHQRRTKAVPPLHIYGACARRNFYFFDLGLLTISFFRPGFKTTPPTPNFPVTCLRNADWCAGGGEHGSGGESCVAGRKGFALPVCKPPPGLPSWRWSGGVGGGAGCHSRRILQENRPPRGCIPFHIVLICKQMFRFLQVLIHFAHFRALIW